jgi:hypothetical protein
MRRTQISRRKGAGAHVNHSLYSADRATHLKVLVIAVCAVAMMLGIVLSSRDRGYTQTARAEKAGRLVMVTGSDVIVR